MIEARISNDYKKLEPIDAKLPLYHRWLLALFVALHLLCTFFIVYLSNLQIAYIPVLGLPVGTTASGILAQGQVIAVILITVNPVKRSRNVALSLCALSGGLSLWNVIGLHNVQALPGIIIPLSSAIVCLIISSYGKRLKTQLRRLTDYSRIVKKNEEMLHTLAYYDSLTGLPNRKMMMDEIERLTAAGATAEHGFLLAYLDLDNFKKINDTMGHSAGDGILKGVAQRWKQQCHPSDMLARFSGDEFVVVIRRNLEQDLLADYLHGFREALAEPFCVERKDFNICTSCGVTRFPDDGTNAEELLKNADIAMYKAKHMGKNDYQLFNAAMREEVTRKIQLEHDLSSAIKKNELYMVYQPQWRSGRHLRGFEALARWKHSELGSVSPMEFIPIAEENGFIVEMGEWIIETVLADFQQLQKGQPTDTVVCINISVKQVLEPSFVPMVREILQRTGFDGRNLEFEITESVFIVHPEYVIGIIKELKALGIRIALDDFGTGYASLNHLQMLPVDVLKIDKTFVDKIKQQHTSDQMVGAIISLSHKLGLEVVAEGVEEEDQLSYLDAQECDYIQGYLLSKPIEKQEVEKLIGNREE